MLDFDDNLSITHTVLTYYLPLVFSILSLICCVLFIFTYLKYEMLRINSGKIHFILGFCITFLTMHFLASLFYELDHAAPDSKESYIPQTWCTVLGIITNLVIYNFLLFHLFLCHNLLCCILYKESTFNRRYRLYIAVSLIISILITIILGMFNEIGYGPMGFCWLRNQEASQIVHIFTICVIFPLVIGILIYVYSKEHFIIPHSLYYYNEDNFTKNNRRLFIRINLGYGFVFTLTWLPASIIYVLEFIFYLNDLNINDYWYAIIRAITLNFLCSSAFLMFLVRIHDPIVRNIIKKFMRKKWQKQENQANQNFDSQEDQEDLDLAEKLIEKNEAKFKNSRNIQPQQYDILISNKKPNNHNNDSFSFLKKRKPTLLKSSSKVFLENEKTESKLLMIKCFLGSTYLIKNDINSKAILINAKTPWDDHYYNDVTDLKSKLGDIIKTLMKNDDETIDKMLKIFKDNLLDDVNCLKIASLVFRNIKTLYNIDDINLFDSLSPLENIKILEMIDYDPFSLKEEISINNFVYFNNRYFLKILSESRINFLKDFFLKDLHDHYIKSKGNSFLAPMISLDSYVFGSASKQVNIAIYDNLIGNIPLANIYALIILEGVNIIHKKLKNGVIVSTEIFLISDYQLENLLKLKHKDKGLLMRVLKNDLKFLLSRDVTNYQIHLIFSINPEKVNIQNSKTINNPLDCINFSQINERKNGFKFECLFEVHECRVNIHNFLNTHGSLSKNITNLTINNVGSSGTINGSEVNKVLEKEKKVTILKKQASGINENFSGISPDVYAKTFMDALQELL